MQFEYKLLEYKLGFRHEWEKEWEYLGNEGWDFINEANGYHIFKRPKEEKANGFMPCEECSVRPACKAVCKDCIMKEQPKEEKPTDNFFEGLHKAIDATKERPCTCPGVIGALSTSACPKHDA